MHKALLRIPSRLSSIGTFAPVHSKFLIIGAGDGGVSTATYLHYDLKRFSGHDVTIVDPKTEYTYQSGMTMVGGGLKSLNDIKISMAKRIRPKITHIHKSVSLVKPEHNTVVCDDGTELTYEYLILSVGIHPKLELIKGLKEAIEDNHVPVATNYLADSAIKMNELRKSFKGGKALFTQPSTPIKCGGAPLKIMFLSANDWKKSNIKSDIKFFTGMPKIFANPYYLPALEGVAKGYDVNINTRKELIEVNSSKGTAIFKDLDNNTTFEEKFDLMHVTPIMKPPAFLAASKLTNANGFVNVNISTLQHNVYKNIFALGDCADLPTSRTLSAINEQFHIVVKNVTNVIEGREPSATYDGYTGCPVFVGDNKVMLCEFGYNNRIMPTFFKDQRKPSRFFYHLKVNVFDKLALYNACGIIRPLRKTFSNIPYNKHRDYQA